ncbi:tyrosine-protein kinase RYK-like [Penaeus indicus]|uniref:tyrosine-protein kinase RYK-like n=1 Tax=Penaeus indicus TaxID=29960 RepID=UPI00300D2B9D
MIVLHRKYLLGCSRGTSEGVKLLTRDLVHIAIQVCLGLIHLHQQRLLHKDVATRNCLIDSELQVRVSDTALARDLFPQDYHCLGDNENRPVKWLSLEALIHKQFTPANDVEIFLPKERVAFDILDFLHNELGKKYFHNIMRDLRIQALNLRLELRVS